MLLLKCKKEIPSQAASANRNKRNKTLFFLLLLSIYILFLIVWYVIEILIMAYMRSSTG
jgi:hypothetical protein